MTRIIAGQARGRRLRTPTGDRTRPTSDRVREALFSSLEASLGSLAGVRFLDLYAGSGAVGLEARSRGAGLVTLVEHDHRTASVIRDNARSLGYADVEIVATTVARALAAVPPTPYDVVFADPPYALADESVRRLLEALVAGWVAPGTLVVLERSSRDTEPSWPEGLVAERSRRYGETTLWYGRATSEPD